MVIALANMATAASHISYTLQHTATHCNTIPNITHTVLAQDVVIALANMATAASHISYTTTHCNTLQHTATHYLTSHTPYRHKTW